MNWFQEIDMIYQNIDEWAVKTLSAEEYENFKLANLENANLWKNYKNEGKVESETVYETVYVTHFDETLEVATESKFKVLGESVEITPNWQYWIDRFLIEAK